MFLSRCLCSAFLPEALVGTHRSCFMIMVPLSRREDEIRVWWQDRPSLCFGCVLSGQGGGGDARDYRFFSLPVLTGARINPNPVPWPVQTCLALPEFSFFTWVIWSSKNAFSGDRGRFRSGRAETQSMSYRGCCTGVADSISLPQFPTHLSPGTRTVQ